MRLPSPTRRAALAAGAVPVAVALAFSALGDGSAAGAPSQSAPAVSTSASSVSAPIVTPLAAALVPGRIHIDRKRPSNVVTARIDFGPGDSTGWHVHPGPVFVQVVSGAITLTHAAHGRCLSQVVRAGHGFFEAPGAVHLAENRQAGAAELFATFVLPPNAGPQAPVAVPAACH